MHSDNHISSYKHIAPELAGQTESWRPSIDIWLLSFFFIFCAISIFLIYDPESSSEFYKKQSINYVIAFLFFVLLSQIPINILRLLSPYLYGIGIIMLILVFFLGIKGKGAQRWLDLGFLHLQPSEFFKFLLPIMLAWWLNLADEYALNKWLTWLVVSLIIALSVFLIAIQPDLGSALMVLISGLIIIFLIGLPWKLILTATACMILSFPILWNNMHGYQKDRVLTFLDPYKDPLGSGYHSIQSMIAIGSGGWFGQGWLQGSQSRLDFVPEQHTDFIFSIIAEEYGFVGGILLLLLYFALVWRGLMISIASNNHFSRILGTTLSIVIFLYVAVNIAMVLGLLPIVGLPLPLISYGGSSLIAYTIILGILSSIKCHSTHTDEKRYIR